MLQILLGKLNSFENKNENLNFLLIARRYIHICKDHTNSKSIITNLETLFLEKLYEAL